MFGHEICTPSHISVISCLTSSGDDKAQENFRLLPVNVQPWELEKWIWKKKKRKSDAGFARENGHGDLVKKNGENLRNATKEYLIQCTWFIGVRTHRHTL